MTTPLRKRRLLATVLAGMMAVPALSLGVVLATPTSASAAGDVCDLCSINFDLGLCQDAGGYPYDSTQESPPPAISGGGSVPAPAPEAPAPAPAAPAPAAPAPAPAAPKSSGGTSSGTSVEAPAEAPAAPVATAPAAPAAPKLAVSKQSLTVTWVAPADGGSAITGYSIVLNNGAPLAVAAGLTSYTIPTLAAGSYTATITASNAAGVSAASAASSAATIAKASAKTDAAAASNGDAKLVSAKSETSAAAESGIPASAAGGIILVALVALGGAAVLARTLIQKRRQPVAAGIDGVASSTDIAPDSSIAENAADEAGNGSTTQTS